MTTVTLYKLNGITYGFTITGHSMYGMNGSDILCSAISSTSQMAINGAFKYEVVGCDDIKSFKQDESVPTIEFIYNTKARGHKESIMLKSFEDFIVPLSEMYKEHIKIGVFDGEREV